jgi:alkylation response protein AidB-like acyl-CoA dehydrogenase
MNIGDTAEEAAYRARVRTWIDTEGRRRWRAPGGDIQPERSWVRALHEAGLVGVTWPAEYGGQALTTSHEAIVAEELAAAGTPISTSMGVGLNMVGPTLLVHGSAEQRRRLLPMILSGTAVWCEGFSEPDAGSDLAALRTRARPSAEGDGSYLIYGQKVWCSYAHMADFCLLLARTGAPEDGRRGITCFIVPMDARGITVRPLRQASGDSEFNELFLDNVLVPADALLDAPGRGWAVTTTTLFYERSRYHDQLAAFAANLRRLARRVAADPGLRCDSRIVVRLGRVWTDLQMVRATMIRLDRDFESPTPSSAASLAVKLLWTSALADLAALAIDVIGPRAVIESADETVDGRSWQQQLFLSQMWAVAGGSTEIARSVIAEQMLRLPRSR